MLLTHRKQHKALLKDVGKAASRIADESRTVAETARSELGGLGTELRDQASESMTQARLATAARLAGAAQKVEPSGKKRRRLRLRLVIPAVIGGIVAAKLARHRRMQEQTDELAAELSEQDATAATTPSAKSQDKSNKSKATQNA